MFYSGNSKNGLTDLTRDEARETLFRLIKGKNQNGGIYIAAVHYTDRS